MSNTIENTIETLKQMRLPELRARYAEVIGEESRCPNKTWLARKIAEAQAQDHDEEPETAIDETEAADTSPATDEATPADAEQANDGEAASEEPADAQQDEGSAKSGGVKLSKLSIPELQALYLEVVGRPTGSANRAYIQWKVRQAQKGKIPVGPRRSRKSEGEAANFKVLPLRMESELVAQLDDARERLGLKSRMELFRRSLHAFLLEAGEVRVAEMFAPEA